MMTLYEDGFLKLSYDATYDILYVPCPHIQEFELLHIQKALSIVVETLISYDIKRFLFDSSNSQIDLPAEDHYHLIGQLIRGLMPSRLQKLARVGSTDTMRENSIERFLDNSEVQYTLPFKIQNFPSKAAAINWLIKEE
ncbi:hypothetical protein H8S95_01580 [Pontibacter sp. KCTC 32443]|uniref:hypothetical protein n=1 Tax=Pontibacter TaxID=323449 RepID=UPI00164E103C|nr:MULTISPECIES: hypothetical protein [Pontibacter]MBC5772740.1 hypothetical protein [Pontibacter sp. KCTC 32443]